MNHNLILFIGLILGILIGVVVKLYSRDVMEMKYRNTLVDVLKILDFSFKAGGGQEFREGGLAPCKFCAAYKGIKEARKFIEDKITLNIQKEEKK